MRIPALLIVLLLVAACDARKQPARKTPGTPPGKTPPEPATRTVRVRLVDADGQLVKGSVWWAKEVDAEHGNSVYGEGKSEIVLRDIPDERIFIVALPDGFVVPSEGWPRRAVPAGVTETKLLLDTGAKRTLRVVGWEQGKLGGVRLAATTDLEPSHHGVEEDGTIRLEGIRPGVRYNLYVNEDDGDRCALLRDLPAEEPWPLIELARGQQIAGKLVLPEGCEHANVAVMVDRAVMIDATENEDGTFLIRAVPHGRWTLVAWTTFDGEYLAATAVSEPGKPVVLDLTKKPDK